MTSGAQSQSGGANGQEDDVLRDVLDELDRERTRRAELELQMRKMNEEHEALRLSNREAQQKIKEQEKLIQKLRNEREGEPAAASAFAATPKPEPENKRHYHISNRAFMAMETQVKEFQSLVNELTKGKPAIAAAAAAGDSKSRGMGPWQQSKSSTTLPLYVVRLLEILPWTPHAHEHVFAHEEIFEWQYYDAREQQWFGNLRVFPQVFKSLPVFRPKNTKEMVEATKEKDRGLLLFLAGGSGKNPPTSPSKHGVLTDEQMTHILNIENGYPLPNDGGIWEWIGGWRVEKRVSSSQPSTGSQQSIKLKVDCDEDGWSYAQEAECFKVNPAEWVWDNPGKKTKIEGNKVDYQRKLRRRKWSRQRVLVDYPHASEGTKEYLKLLAENARLTVTTNKISDQLVVTKTMLTENEELLMRERSEAAAAVARLKAELESTNELLRLAGLDVDRRPGTDSMGSTGNPIQDFLQNNEQMKKISQWVKNTRAGDSTFPLGSPSSGPQIGTLANLPPDAETLPDAADSTASSTNSPNKHGGFDWKKVGRVFQKGPLQQNQLDQKKEANSHSRLLEKLGEAGQHHSSEGSSTDESIEDMEMQEDI